METRSEYLLEVCVSAFQVSRYVNNLPYRPKLDIRTFSVPRGAMFSRLLFLPDSSLHRIYVRRHLAATLVVGLN